MLENIIPLTRKPDILDCLANLSSDEVFTPPDIANKVLDMLPREVWSNPELKFLDPCAKSGVFLREIAKRLMKGLEGSIPNEDKRREHIFKNMVYGIAITELTSLISKRSLYYSKDATNEHSVVEMDDEDGNIYFQRTEHTYKGGKCIHCGVNEGSLDRGDERENYAYAFIHRPLKEIFNMKFDVIIGNPPYQLEDGAGKAGASPLYHKFINMAKSLEPTYISFIVPARWYAGGKGLDEFRAEMLDDDRISKLVDYQDAADCFPGVEIKGGVCYFLWDKNYSGPCEVTQVINGERSSPAKRNLNDYDVFVRSNQAISILEKVVAGNPEKFSKYVSAQTPFGLHTTYKFKTMKLSDDQIQIFGNQSQGWIDRDEVKYGKELIDKYKLFLSYAYNGGDKWPHQIIGKPIPSAPPSCCTQTYAAIGPFENAEDVEKIEKYMKTKFFRFMVSLRKITQHNPKDRFDFVPDIGLDDYWTDEKLYEKYNLDTREIEYIESLIREMV